MVPDLVDDESSYDGDDDTYQEGMVVLKLLQLRQELWRVGGGSLLASHRQKRDGRKSGARLRNAQCGRSCR